MSMNIMAISNFPAEQKVAGTFWQAIQPVSIKEPLEVMLIGGAGSAITGLTDTELRATPLSVIGTVVTGGLTDTQLRATPVPISGTVTSNVGTGTRPVSGTFWQATQPVSAASLPLPAGAAIAANQQTNAITDAQIRATPLPVSGTITANAGSGTLAVSAASLPLPAGAATAAKQPALGTAGTASADVLTVQGKASMTPLLTDGSATTQPVSAAALPLPAGAATAANQQSNALTDAQLRATPVPVSGTVTATTGGLTDTQLRATPVPVSGTVTTSPPSNASTNLAQVAGTTPDTNSGSKSAGTLRVVLATDQPALTNKLLVTPDSVALPANQSVNNAQINGVTPLMGNGVTGTGSQRVTIASDNTPFHVIHDTGSTTAVTGTVATKETRAATPAQSSVANSITSVSLLASNANRLGTTIFNDDTAGSGATLKVKLGATASATSFTVAIAPQGYFEVPFSYTGAIDGIASAATGNARITELT